MGDLEDVIREGCVMFGAECCRKGLPFGFWSTYSAFANTFGGRIVLGLTDGGDDHSEPIPTGIEDPDGILHDIWEQVDNPRMVSINILTHSDVEVIDIDGMDLIVIDVPRAERRKRPVYVDNNVNNGTYRRNDDGNYHCSMSEISEMIRDSMDEGSDSALCTRVRMSEIDEEMDPARTTVHIGRNIIPPVPRGKIQDETILEYLASHGDDSVKVTSEALGLSVSTLSRRISALREEGRVERIGSRKTGRWVVR